MTTKYARLLAVTSLALAAGGLAACGSDSDGTARSGDDMPMNSTVTSTASAAEVDQAFVRQMIPHHQLAVEMAEQVNERGEHTEVRELAADIISSQQDEISQMETIAKELGTSADSRGAEMGADAQALGLPMDDMGMNMSANSLKDGGPLDRTFIDEMIPHHEGAIAMAQAQLKSGSDPRLKKLATGIIAAQEQEITEMKTWRQEWYGDAEASDDDGHMMDGDEMGSGAR